jgi:predicted amidohydrolase
MIAACAQIPATTIERAAEVWPAVERLCAQARAAGAELVVLPEATYPAYWLGSAEAYWSAGIERSETVLARFRELARRHRVWLVAGFVEEEDGRLFNSAAVVDADGSLVGIARKNFLWDCDNRWFSPGGNLSVFETAFGRMGVLICADGRCPEISATLAVRGATFVAVPTAWVNAASWTGSFRNIQADFLIQARAMEFGVPYICASKSGREGTHLEYVGQSQIVDAEGRMLARAPIDGEHLIVAEVRPTQPRAPQMDAETASRLLDPSGARRYDSQRIELSFAISADASTLERSITQAGGRVARMTGKSLETFTAARLAALQGTQAIVVDGPRPTALFVRARAAENRVFVIVVGSKVDMVADPTGAIVYDRGAETSAVKNSIKLDLSIADDKRVTPETDIWEQRRVGCYQLGG